MFLFDQLFGQLSSQLVAMRPLSNELLDLSQFNRSWISCLTLVAWSVDGSWLFACGNCLAYWILELQAV